MNSNDEKMAHHRKVQEAREILKAAEEATNERIIDFAYNRSPASQKVWARAVKFSNIRKNIEEILVEQVYDIDFEDRCPPNVFDKTQKLFPLNSYQWDEFVLDVIKVLFDDGAFEPEQPGVFYTFDCDLYDDNELVWRAMSKVLA